MIQDGTVISADFANDPRNASSFNSGDVPLAQLGNDPSTSTAQVEADIALLGFKIAANGTLAKYNLVDQTVDAFEDGSGIDASVSTGENRNVAGKYYSGASVVTGGTITSYSSGGTDYKSHTFTSTGNLVLSESGSVDYLIVAGGGGGGNAGANTGAWGAGGGGGAGGVLTGSGLALTAQTYTITVGAGGSGGGYQEATPNAASGDNSSIVPVTSGTSYIAIGGGGAANSYATSVGLVGGSGGGGSYAARASGAGTAGPPRQGYDGGTNTFVNAAAGGGGAGGQGGTAGPSTGGVGGTGISNNYRDGTSGTTIGTNYFAGGGAGGAYNVPAGTATYGGGPAGIHLGTVNGTSNGSDGTANSGGGGGGGSPNNQANPATGGAGGDGGKGIVVVRYQADAFGAISNMTLVSNSTTAEAAPTKGDVVMTYTNGAGTAVINTDITAEFSADNGVTYTSMTLASQGTTGGHTILTANDVTRTSTSGTSMRYRIKTLNQSATKETRIHAVSLGWA